jgi:hypothetical protein
MIIRLTAEQLRKIADQVDAYTALEASGADHQKSNTVITVDGVKIAYLHWWDSKEQYMSEFICFTPGDAEPLEYHEEPLPGKPACRFHPGPGQQGEAP